MSGRAAAIARDTAAASKTSTTAGSTPAARSVSALLAERVVPTASIGNYLQHHVAFVGKQSRARRQVQIALRPDRVGCAVALLHRGRAVEKRANGLVTLDVYDAQTLPLTHDTHPGFTRGHDFIEHSGGRIQQAFNHLGGARRRGGRTRIDCCHDAYSISVLRKPRPFSEQRSRQASCAGAGPVAIAISRT